MTVLSRRRFGVLACSGVAAMAVSRSGWGKTEDIAAGIQLYTVGGEVERDPAGTLKKLAQIGYKEVEIASLGKLPASQWRALFEEAGLRAPSVHLPFGLADTDKILGDAKALGVEYACSSILLPRPLEGVNSMEGFFKAFNAMSSAMTTDDFKQVAGKANEFGQKAKGLGLQYVYHNHNFEFRDLGHGATGYDMLLRETDPALVKFEADTGWMRVAGADPASLLGRFPERFAMLHIKDFKNLTKPVTIFNAPDGPVPTELGRGSVELKAVVEAGRKAGVKHMFVEQEPPFKEMTPLEAAAVDYTTLHGLLEQTA